MKKLLLFSALVGAALAGVDQPFEQLFVRSLNFTATPDEEAGRAGFCARGNLLACYLQSSKIDPASLPGIKQACEQGRDPYNCAVLYYESTNPADKLGYISRSCEYGSTAGCFFYAQELENAPATMLPKPSDYVNLLSHLCSKEVAHSCEQLAQYYRKNYTSLGMSAKQAERNAEGLIDRTCSLTTMAPSCIDRAFKQREMQYEQERQKIMRQYNSANQYYPAYQ